MNKLFPFLFTIALSFSAFAVETSPLTYAVTKWGGELDEAYNVASVTVIKEGVYQYKFKKPMSSPDYRVEFESFAPFQVVPKVSENTVNGFTLSIIYDDENNGWTMEKLWNKHPQRPVPVKHKVFVHTN